MQPWLKTGDPAPLFNALDHAGNLVNLAAYRGKWVLLSFYRFVAAGGSLNRELHHPRAVLPGPAKTPLPRHVASAIPCIKICIKVPLAKEGRLKETGKTKGRK